MSCVPCQRIPPCVPAIPCRRASTHVASGSGKPESGNWLTAAGMSAYLRGVALDRDRHLVPSAKLWQTDSRLGIALNPTRRSAEEGRIYTTETVALCRDVGFIAGVMAWTVCCRKRGYCDLAAMAGAHEWRRPHPGLAATGLVSTRSWDRFPPAAHDTGPVSRRLGIARTDGGSPVAGR